MFNTEKCQSVGGERREEGKGSLHTTYILTVLFLVRRTGSSIAGSIKLRKMNGRKIYHRPLGTKDIFSYIT